MNRKYSKHLFRLFEQELQSRWPLFKKCKQKPELGRAYAWLVDGVGNVFLFIWVSSKWEKFYCEFGWSAEAYPTKERADYRFPLLDRQSAYAEAEMIAGAQRLWGDKGTGAWQIPDPVESFNPLDYASNPEAAGHEFVRRVNQQAAMTAEEAEKLVRPVVDELFKRLEADVMPYLLEYIEFVRAHGKLSA
ncbi:MAG: hypothetical protein HY854_05865 [Burkholderiales bacterium]|nr:hypothetical protein [Burkholderiales bacterium]